MNAIMSSVLSVTTVRWIARMLSALCLAFWGFFIVAHLIGGEGRPSRALNARDFVILTTIAIWLIGLAVAWKWELVGGVMTLSALLIGAFFNWQVLVPGILIAIPAVLFLCSWWIGRIRTTHERTVVMR